ncbi:hypothetical protein CENSYa_1050 [Cenarchaeum symbiosum A]|uniref:Uncharacterized protein n=1 Tax=Cenarchaeum symbiosum (strain A) TaxID=414004 RepID=A0RWG4_CENSY|nr:hypothetical protein CENSYa_1050 [Cenarchaeum symbiosum A]
MEGLSADFTEIIPKDRMPVSASFRVMYNSVNGVRSSVNVDMRKSVVARRQTKEMPTHCEDLSVT